MTVPLHPSLSECWKLSISGRFPGEHRRWFLACFDLKNIALLVSSGPLSQTMAFGSARCAASRSSSRARRWPEIEKLTTWRTHSRLKSSTTFSTRKRRAFACWSLTKSIDHRSYTLTGTAIGARGRVSFLRRLVGTCIVAAIFDETLPEEVTLFKLAGEVPVLWYEQ